MIDIIFSFPGHESESKCKDCGKSFIRKESVKNHVCTAKVKKETKKKHFCEFCGAAFANEKFVYSEISITKYCVKFYVDFYYILNGISCC